MLQYGEMLKMKKSVGLFLFVSVLFTLGSSSLFEQVQAAEDASLTSSTIAETEPVDESVTADADSFEPESISGSEPASEASTLESFEEGTSALEDSSIDPIAESSESTNIGMPVTDDSPEVMTEILAEAPSGIATQAYYATQSSSTIMTINAHISYATYGSDGLRDPAPIDKIYAYMQSADGQHTVNLSVSPTSDGRLFNLSFDEKLLILGEKYLIFAQVDGTAEQIYAEWGDQNTILGILNTGGSSLSYTRDETPLSQLTIKNLLQTALKPTGSTLYVWGGGWDTEWAVKMGVNPQWQTFFDSQSARKYKYVRTKYQSNDGLDCSGFVGWAIYNTVNTVDYKDGYVMLAQQMASNYASRGWGTYTSSINVTDYKPGDIMSLPSGHVYIVLGIASDGSLVILHSTPDGGVQINGSPAPSTRKNSKAVQLATYYMSKYPVWYQKFGTTLKTSTYVFTEYNQMRWDVSGDGLLADPDGITSMSAEDVLSTLLGE